MTCFQGVDWKRTQLAFLAWYLTAVVVAVSVTASRGLDARPDSLTQDVNVVWRFARSDGEWYFRICEAGYEFRPGELSSVTFFPAYPFLARLVGAFLALPAVWSLIVTSQLSLGAAFLIFAAYLAARSPELGKQYLATCLVSFGLFPTTFFFRMAYSESVFLLLATLAMLGIVRRWPIWLIASIVGAATGARPVGVALVPVLGVYGWRHFREEPRGILARTSCGKRMVMLGAVLLLGCWGVLGYAGYLWAAFGDLLAFAKAQALWQARSAETLGHKLVATSVLEPIWGVYVPGGAAYWGNYDHKLSFIFSLQFWNPIYFVGTVALVVVGWRKKWLNDYEVLLSTGLLLIPYVTKSYDNAMASLGRFSAVVFPAYIVMAHLLALLPRWLAAMLLVASAFFLAAYSALFAAGYLFI